MADDLRIALAQMNAVVGDIDGNAAKIEELAAQAREAGARLVVFPELALTGYPPEDLLLKRGFLRRAQAALEGLAVERHHGGRRMARGGGRAASTTPRRSSPTARSRPSTASCCCRTTASSTSAAGSSPATSRWSWTSAGTPVGITVCEDIWEPEPTAATAAAGAQRGREPVGVARTTTARGWSASG